MTQTNAQNSLKILKQVYFTMLNLTLSNSSERYHYFWVIWQLIAWGQCPSTAPPFTTSLSNANTPSSFGRNFHITFTHWQEHSSVQPYKTSLQEYYNTNCPLLNYLILITTLYLWCCRSNQTLPIITAFSSKVKIKYETEKYICVETNTMEKFLKKWTLPLDSVP